MRSKLKSQLLEMRAQQIHIVAVDVDLAGQLVDARGAQLAIAGALHERAQLALQSPDVAVDAPHNGEATLAAIACMQIDGHHVVSGAGHKIAAGQAIGFRWLPAGGVGRLGNWLWHCGGRQQALHILPFGRIVHDLNLWILFERLQLAGRAETGHAGGLRVQRAHQLQMCLLWLSLWPERRGTHLCQAVEHSFCAGRHGFHSN